MISASRDNDSSALEGLLQCLRNPNVANKDGKTPLSCAAGTCSNHADVTGGTSKTPLCISAHGGFLHAAHLSVAAGADKDQAQNDGATPLLLAAQ